MIVGQLHPYIIDRPVFIRWLTVYKLELCFLNKFRFDSSSNITDITSLNLGE